MKEKILYTIKIDATALFVERPNRFIANCKLENNNEIVTAHVHDSGRIKELLYPGNYVQLRKATDSSKRKTQWDLISAKAEDGEDILLNSAFHRYITDKLFADPDISPFGKISSMKAEVKYGNSRLDYLLEKNGEKIYVETKGVSLSFDKIASFPDAPSIRATKHLKELIEIKKSGFRAAVILIILKDSNFFTPNKITDPLFSKTFYEAINEGVEIYPLQFSLKNGDILYEHKDIKILF